ncbi:MAG TPA: type III-A CRISPR-associated protein Cas10/Csm1 [Desulfuromonadales bacterium]|nr:type III-A CRISPR-associated protein Cas10/Csm1 [Desulfuromonadales bacterium]
MSDMVYTVALAGLLHDVGKFAERAGMEISKQYEQDNAGLYQRYNEVQKRHTHKHALYTAAFIERFINLIPALDEWNAGRTGNSLINLAAMHHKPETPLQWIITQADRLSSGMDRQVFDGDETGTAFRDFRKTRLIPLAEEMRPDGKYENSDTLDSYRHRYHLRALSPAQVFPAFKEAAEPVDNAAASKEYAALFAAFLTDLENLSHRNQPPLWLDHFTSLWERFTSAIPAATVGTVIPDVSLYDHSRATAALAISMYRYHLATDTFNETAIKASTAEKFLLITGDFYGIQNFIFSSGGSTNKAAAKLLRGRSFAVSILSELASDRLCRKLLLPPTSVLLDAAGKFTLIAPNLPETIAGLAEVEVELNSWLLRHYYGEVTIGFSSLSAKPADFEKGSFLGLWEKLGKAADLKKYRKFDLAKAGVVAGYLDSFDNTLSICPFCGKRPADLKTKDDQYLGDNEASCLICRDHIHMGAKLIKSKSMAVISAGVTFAGNRLKEQLFGCYQLSFDLDKATSTELAKSGHLLHMISLARAGESPDGSLAARYISGYVPVYSDGDRHDKRFCKEVLGESGDAKTFSHIAIHALNHRSDSDDKFSGVEALGILKADVDNLGKLFACGLPEERLNLSRLATFSRQLNSFFALYLPNLLTTDIRFQNIYTVFAGGDDLFLIGPWNRIIEFADELQAQFARFACGNGGITISAGITVDKPGVPVPTVADQAEQALESSKHGGKNSLTLFGETVTWAEFRDLLTKRDKMNEWQQSGAMGKALLYRLNELIGMAKKEREIRESKRPIDIRDMACLGWRSRLTYTATRNVGKGMDKTSRTAALDEILEELPAWLLRLDGKLTIALWQVLYNQR